MRTIRVIFVCVAMVVAFSLTATVASAQQLVEITTLRHAKWLKFTSLAFTHDGKTLLTVGTGDSKSQIHFWDASTGKPLKSFELARRIWHVAVSPDDRTLALGTADRTALLCDLATMQVQGTPMTHAPRYAAFRVCTVAFSPDGKKLASGSDNLQMMLWDLQSGKNLWTSELHSDAVRAIAFSPDGKMVASAHSDILLWDVATGERIANFLDHGSTWSLAFSPDGKLLASGGSKGVTLWDMKTLKETATLTRHSNQVLCVAFSRDGKLLASGGMDDRAKIWDVATQKELASVIAHDPNTIAIAFSPNGKILATGGNDGLVKLWKIDLEAKK